MNFIAYGHGVSELLAPHLWSYLYNIGQYRSPIICLTTGAPIPLRLATVCRSRPILAAVHVCMALGGGIGGRNPHRQTALSRARLGRAPRYIIYSYPGNYYCARSY